MLGEFPFTLTTPEPHIAEIGGTKYVIGKGMQVEVLSARLADGYEDWRAAGMVPAAAEADLVPGTSNEAFGQLVTN